MHTYIPIYTHPCCVQADASCALSLAPDHVKSLQRRAAARLALGKLRAAVGDLQRAASIEPAR